MSRKDHDNRDLRQKAEHRVGRKEVAVEDLAGMTPQDVARLMHELHVHQVELEMQNDELRHIATELEKTRDRYLHLYDFAPNAYFTVTEKGAIEQANLTAATLLNRPRADLVGQMFSRFIYRDDQDAWYLRRKRLIETGDFQAFQLRLVRDGGGAFFVNLECTRDADNQNELAHILVSAMDISALKRAENALQQTNATLEQRVSDRTVQVEAKARQLQMLAVELIEAEEHERQRIATLLHDDLQQLLAAAKLQLEFIPPCESDEQALSSAKQLLDESLGKSHRLSHELSPPVLRYSNLVAVLQWVVDHYREHFGLHVELEADEAQGFDEPPLKIFIFRAVQELLFNVVKHSGVKSARVAVSDRDGWLSVAVEDQGKGLNPDLLAPGNAPAGLGLLSLRERARHLGGNLTIQSAPERGSCFTLTVPHSVKTDGPARPETDHPPGATAPGGYAGGLSTIRVLFVDDHQMMRRGLIKLITPHPGIDVAGEASNGREAIEQVRQLTPDVVVMDVSMPEMDGIEATHHIKSQWPGVRVIALSMFDEESIAEAVTAAGAETVISKTAPAGELLKAIFT